jgi:WD40-like Beta Propeller Repeat
MRSLLRRAAVAVLATAAALTGARGAAAYGDPDLDWWTIETAHFRVHYDRPLEPIATRVARLAETIHVRISGELAYTPTQMTEIVLTDDSDSANGSATGLPLNTIHLYVTAPDDLSTIGDYDDWYTELVTHEYTHIAHIDNISGAPAIVNAVLGKTLAPNQAQPHWILEGLAVLSESENTSGGRIRSNLFDMYLRADVLGGRIAGLDQVSNDAYRWPQGDLWYLYGSRFLRWISDVYGLNTMRAIAADYGAALMPLGINRAIRRVTGHTYVELFEGFKDYAKRLYAEQMRAVEKRGLREGTRMTRHGRTVSYPRFLPRAARDGDAEELLYFRADQDARSGLYRLPLAAPREGDRREELVARAVGNSSAAFTPAGDLVFHGISIFKNYYSRYDLFSLPRGEKSPGGDESARRQLTKGLRAQYADVSPDGHKIVFTVNTKGTTFLEIADVDAEGALQHRRDLVPSGRFEQAYTPRFSPDGRKVAYSSWAAGGFRDVRIVDVATGTFEEITHDRALDMTPVWSPDGRTLYFSSDRSGVFNIHAYDVVKRSMMQVTNVRTGAFMPAVSTDGKTLVYVGYTTYGFDLYTMPLDPARFIPAVDALPERPDPPTEPGAVPLTRHPYNPWPSFAPRHYIVTLAPGNYGPEALSFQVTTSDIVANHTFSASINVEPNAPQPSLSLSYTYSRLPVDFSLSFFHQVVPRTDYVVNGQTTPYNEYDNGITTGVSYTYQEDYASHTAGVSFSVAHFQGSLSIPGGLDPTAPIEQDPAQGNLNVLHAGYSYSNVEGSLDASASVRGVALGFALDYASQYTGSSYTIRSISGGISGYIPMPWPGHQTLALRVAGAVSDGDYPRNGAYYVGGYDLADNSLPSAVLSGVFNGSFVLRGYPPGVYYGSEYVLSNIEYRAPLLYVDHGLATLPIYLRRIDANAFVDYGGAFDKLEVNDIRFFSHGALIDDPQLHASTGLELWFGFTLGYILDTQFRLGYAYGFSAEAYKGGQPYFVASSAF